MNREQYGDKYSDHLLEQYKLFVEMADRVSARRGQTNMFYVSLLSGLLALLSIVIGRAIFSNFQTVVFIAIAILGLLFCGVWYVNIQSYRQLNSGKFQVIHEMEQQLPYCCYDREWQILGEGEEAKKYRQLTRVEQYVPLIMTGPYLLLLAYSLCILIN